MCSRYLCVSFFERMRAAVVTLWLNQGGTAFSTSLTASRGRRRFFIFDCKIYLP